jgi:hypothetical protein
MTVTEQILAMEAEIVTAKNSKFLEKVYADERKRIGTEQLNPLERLAILQWARGYVAGESAGKVEGMLSAQRIGLNKPAETPKPPPPPSKEQQIEALQKQLEAEKDPVRSYEIAAQLRELRWN